MKTHSTLLMLTLTLLLPSFTASVQAEAQASSVQPLKVFILIGTSNMAGGGGTFAEMPNDLRHTQKDVLVCQDKFFHPTYSWVPLQEGEWHQAGPEHSFAQAMVKNLGEPIGLIKVIQTLKKGGDSNRGPETLAVYWSPENSDSRYVQLVQLVKDLQAKRSIAITGVLWDQSGRDTQREETAKPYQKNMTHLIECMRRDFGNPTLPFVCALDNTHPSHPQKFPFMDMVREAQKSITLPAYRFFDQNDLPRVMDTAKPEETQKLKDDHFTTAGEVESGKRYAAAMIELLKGAGTQKDKP